jgi:hypothetical protein
MAEERNLGTARALDIAGDEDTKKAELQRQMEEARESISNTVNEIKDTVTTQYQHVRESVSEALDWREQFRKRPVAWSVGALSVGFIVGYGVAAAAKGEGEPEIYYDTYDAGEDEEGALSGTSYRGYEQERRGGKSYGQAKYAAANLPSSQYSSSASQTAARPSYSSGYVAPAQEEQEEEPSGPSLYERFKETKAYDRLQDELGNFGNRFIDQLSLVGSTVVLPALFSKLKDLIGVDLSGNQPQGSGGQRSLGSTQQASSASSRYEYDQGRSGSASEGSGSSNQSTQERSPESRAAAASSYGTSENQAYGIEHRDSEAYEGGTRSGSGGSGGGTAGV